jgi:hypothetical protein
VNESTLKPDLLRKYAGGRKIFIETGTAKGDGLQNAIDYGFQKFYSIEANMDVYLKAMERFCAFTNVELLTGDGGQVLKGLLRYIQEPAVFWLDSHWSIGEPSLPEGISLCPLLNELRAIADHPIKEHLILVDDIRYFWKGLPQWGGVSIGQIVQLIVEANPNYWIRFEEGVTKADILVAVPNMEIEVHEAVEEYEKHA